MPIGDQDIKKDLKRLGEFLDELQTIQADLKKSTILSKVSTRYETNLNKLIKATEGIINNTATKSEQDNFDKLIKTADQSLKVLEKQNRNDDEFQGEFKEVFGEVRANEQLSASILKRMGTTLTAVVTSANVVSAEARKDVSDTALSFATGPFGKVMQDTFAGAGDKFKGMIDKIRSGPVDGQAHNGMTNVPKEGSYLLDGGERVLSGEQNTDLSSFMESGGPLNTKVADELNYIRRNTAPLSSTSGIPVFNMDHDARYFDSLIDNEDRIATEQERAENSRWKVMKEKTEILTEIIAGIQNSWFTSQVIAMNIWFRRFKRMPFLMSIGLLSKGMTGMFKVMGGLFGITGFFRNMKDKWFGTEAKTNEEKLIQANIDIERAVRGEAKLDRKGRFQKMFEGLNKNLKSFFIGGTGQKRDAKGRFMKKDKGQETLDLVSKISNTLLRSLGVSEEMLEEMEKGKKKGGLLGMLGGAGKFILGALGLTALGGMLKTGLAAMLAKAGAGLAASLPMILTRALPAGAALFAGFKLGEILNEKIGEWLDLDMDLGSYIGQSLFGFVKGITDWFDNAAAAFKQSPMKTFASIASGQGIPDMGLTGPGEPNPSVTETVGQPAQQAVPIQDRVAAATLPARRQAAEFGNNVAAAASQAGTTVVNTVNNTVQRAKAGIDELAAYESQR